MSSGLGVATRRVSATPATGRERDSPLRGGKGCSLRRPRLGAPTSPCTPCVKSAFSSKRSPKSAWSRRTRRGEAGCDCTNECWLHCGPRRGTRRKRWRACETSGFGSSAIAASRTSVGRALRQSPRSFVHVRPSPRARLGRPCVSHRQGVVVRRAVGLRPCSLGLKAECVTRRAVGPWRAFDRAVSERSTAL